jgi:molecular chaperone GrpE
MPISRRSTTPASKGADEPTRIPNPTSCAAAAIGECDATAKTEQAGMNGKPRTGEPEGRLASADESAPPASPAADAERLAAEPDIEVAELEDQLLRALAEQENIRKRAQREIEDGAKFAVSDFARDLLSTADDLRRAVETMPDTADHAARQLRDGIAAIERGFAETLKKYGVQRIDPLGLPFDPHRHQAIFEADVDQPVGTVIEVLQPGYLHNGRLLRAAMVGVARDRTSP